MTDIKGVDLSHWDGDTGAALRAIAKAGAQFAILKATEGISADASFDDNVKLGRDLGLELGAYHFGRGDFDPVKQAEAYVRVVEKVDDVDAMGMAVDFERPRGYVPFRWPAIKRVADRVSALIPATHPLFGYTSQGYLEGIGNPDLTGTFDAMWGAYYTLFHQPLSSWDTHRVRFIPLGGFPHCAIMQPGPVIVPEPSGRRDTHDGDVFRGTIDELKALFRTRTQPRRPLEQRAPYRQANNTFVAAVRIYASGLNVPDPGSHPAWAPGVANAKAATLDALDGLVLQDPTS